MLSIALRAFIAGFLIASAAALPAAAEANGKVVVDPPPQGWSFSFAPYLWALTITGDIGVAG